MNRAGKKLRIALDFDDLIANASIVKRRWIAENVPEWRHLLAISKAGDMATAGVSAEKATRIAEKYASKLHSIPPWLTDRINCIPVIGKENYEKMSYEVYGTRTLQIPEIEGVKGSLKELAAKGHELIILTSRRSEHLKFVDQWLLEKGMKKWFKGIHSTREIANKIPFCIDENMDVIVDDEIRFLRGKAPKLLKILVASGREIHDRTTTKIIDHGKFKVVQIMDFIKAENITLVPEFHPYVENMINGHFGL